MEHPTKNNKLLIENNIELLKENFKNGICEYKNFGELCALFNINYKKANSDSKKSIIKELERHCKFHKKEHSQIIEIKNIYDRPNPIEKIKRNRKSQYAEHLYPILLELLFSNRFYNGFYWDNYALFDRYNLFDILGFSNNWYATDLFNNQNPLSDLDKLIIEELRENCWDIINQVFTRTLEYLKNDNKIIFSKCYMFSHILETTDNTYSPSCIAENEIEQLIQEKMQEVYTEFHCENGYQFYKSFIYKAFKNSLNEKLKEFNIAYDSTKYKLSISTPETNIEETFNSFFNKKNLEQIKREIKNHKLYINKKILSQIYKRNIKEANEYFEPNQNKNHFYIERKDDIFRYIKKEYKIMYPHKLIDKNELIKNYINKRNQFIEQIIKIS